MPLTACANLHLMLTQNHNVGKQLNKLANTYVAWHVKEHSRLQAAGLLFICLTKALNLFAACTKGKEHC